MKVSLLFLLVEGEACISQRFVTYFTMCYRKEYLSCSNWMIVYGKISGRISLPNWSWSKIDQGETWFIALVSLLKRQHMWLANSQSWFRSFIVWCTIVAWNVLFIPKDDYSIAYHGISVQYSTCHDIPHKEYIVTQCMLGSCFMMELATRNCISMMSSPDLGFGKASSFCILRHVSFLTLRSRNEMLWIGRR